MKNTAARGRGAKPGIAYTIVASDPAAHLYDVTVTVAAPDPAGQLFVLPAWIPGSYMIREFARNIVQIRAECGGEQVLLTKLDKHSWQAVPCDGPLTLYYEVYAWDLSVRAAHLDQTHGFFNGTSVFLRVAGQEQQPHVVDIVRPEDPACADWRVATTLRELKAKRYGFGTYVAADYDELIDHPVEMGTFAMATFKAHGVPHDIVFTGRVPNLDLDRIARDLKKICEAQIALFEPKTKRAPMDRYVFMTMVLGDGHGGLEHRASTALVCSRSDLPALGAAAEISSGYLQFLGLCSHEYFHTWNVKRIKPAVFAPYELTSETYTPLLWLFEGFTSYYDDLMLARAGLIDELKYLGLVEKTFNGVLRGSGRGKQSVAESSFDAWTKYYRQDENAPNAIVSYYAKGSLVGLGFDLTIRAKTGGKKTLDDVMRALWQRYGRDFYNRDGGPGEGRGVTPAEVVALFEEVSGVKLRGYFDKYVYGTQDVPLAKLYAPFGVTVSDKGPGKKPGLEIRTARDGNDCKVANVYEGGPAHQAGLSAGDVLVAVDGLRVTMAPSPTLDTLLGRYSFGDVVQVHAFRRDELMTFAVTLGVDGAPAMAIAAGKAVKGMKRPHAG
ncbi:MAG TPA: M61 family metallopeptidase [Burkholderiaceae bacterium]